jgi:endonuclease YncB( thermonuclease family)
MKINILRDGGVAACFLVLLFLISQKIEDDKVQTFTGRYRVVDGDSLALGKTRFRLLGIDAPELSQVCRRDGNPWKCGESAKERLATFIGDGSIDCKGGRKDKYRRLLVTCFSSGLNINREMVRLGMAVTFGAYEAEERKARDAHAGIWASDFARPVDWRRANKAGMEEGSHQPSFPWNLFGGDS